MLQQNPNELFGQPNTFKICALYTGASMVAQMVKNLPVIQDMLEMWVQSLGQEDPMEKEMATHSSILPWKIPWTKEPGSLQSIRSQRVTHDLATKQQ